MFATRSVYAANPYDAPFYYEIIPGGTHFHAGDTREGAAFLALETALAGAAVYSGGHLNRNGASEWNVPLILAGQVYAVDKWRYFQKNSFRLRKAGQPYGIKYDPAPFSQLLMAPFDPGTIASPLVLVFTLLGITDGVVGYPHNSERYSDITSVKALGWRMNRRDGTIYYETAATAVSYGAAVSEEMLFRGMLLPRLDYSFGKPTGLITSSLVFGLLHLTNYNVDRPFYMASQASLAGLVLGWYVQKNNYSLKHAIAAHFWYDIASLTTTWLANPAENPLGVSVGFRF